MATVIGRLSRIAAVLAVLLPGLAHGQALDARNNLSDVQSPTTALTNLGAASAKGTLQRLGLRVQAFGDSEDNFNTANTLANSGLSGQFIAYQSTGVLATANKFLGGQLNFDLSVGWPQSLYLGGLSKIFVVSGGAYSVAPTGATRGSGSRVSNPSGLADGATSSLSIANLNAPIRRVLPVISLRTVRRTGCMKVSGVRGFLGTSWRNRSRRCSGITARMSAHRRLTRTMRPTTRPGLWRCRRFIHSRAGR